MSKAKKKAPAAKSKVKPKVKPKAKPVKKLSKPVSKKIVIVAKKVPVKKSPQKAPPAVKSAVKPLAAKPAPKPAPAKPAATDTTRKRMNKEELKYFENLLNEKKETLIQELGYLEDNTMRLNSKDGAGDLSSHAYHLADHATETQDREQAFHMASREGRYLFYIEEALDRVRAGTFGVCKSCGRLIPKARLEAVPTAKMCIDCKSKQEQSAASVAETVPAEVPVSSNQG